MSKTGTWPLLIAVVIVACGGTSDFERGFEQGRQAAGSASLAAASRPPSSGAASASAATGLRAKIGAPVTYPDGWKVTAVRWEEQPPSRLTTPAPGLRFVVVVVRVDNATTRTEPVNPFNFKLSDSAGVRRDTPIGTPARSDELHNTFLEPGSFVSGSIVFEAPIGDSKLQLLYEVRYYSLRTARWELY
jgi:hypothetical protein